MELLGERGLWGKRAGKGRDQEIRIKKRFLRGLGKKMIQGCISQDNPEPEMGMRKKWSPGLMGPSLPLLSEVLL